MTSIAKIIKLESEILVRFEGHYVDPRSTLSLDEGPIEIMTVSGPVPENPSAEPSKRTNQGADRMKIGTMKKSEKKAEGSDKPAFDLKFNIPFLKVEDMWALPNSRKETDKHPDYVVMNSGMLCGGLWKRTSTNGDDYLSGNVESPIFPTGKIQFAIWKEKDAEGNFKGYKIESSRPQKSDSKPEKPQPIEEEEDFPF